MICFLSLFSLFNDEARGQARLLGDLDGDGEVTVLDLVRLINHLQAKEGANVPGATGELPAPLQPFADLNGDSFVDQTDVGLMTDAILGLSLPSKPVSFEPGNGASEVGITVRPKVIFPRPIDVSTLNSNNFFASFAGRKLSAIIVAANNGTFAWLFFNEPMPNASQIQVTVDGSTIRTLTDAPLDVFGDGIPGGSARISFSTVNITPIPGTVLSSRVVDPGPDLIPRTTDDATLGNGYTYLLPIEGVRVYVLGLESNFTYTDSEGRFVLTNMPVGDVKVVLDGRTAGHPPAGYYFPEMVMDTHFEPGITNGVMTIRDADGNVVRDANGVLIQALAMYLPRVALNVLQMVSATNTTMVTLASNASYTLSENQRQYLTMEIKPNSLVGMDGKPLASAQVGVSVVPTNLVQDMLPPGLLQHTFDITVQAPGVSTFSIPAAMTFPNVFNAPPGTKLNFLSFDHTTGRLVIEGTATVSDDGLFVRTDPGTGITHPGWHGLAPPGATGTGDKAFSGGGSVGPHGGRTSPAQTPALPPVGPPPPTSPPISGSYGACANFLPFQLVWPVPLIGTQTSPDGEYYVQIANSGGGKVRLRVIHRSDGNAAVDVDVVSDKLLWGFGAANSAGVPFAYSYIQPGFRRRAVFLHNLNTSPRPVWSDTTDEADPLSSLAFSPSGSYFVFAWKRNSPEAMRIDVVDAANGAAFTQQFSIEGNFVPNGSTDVAFWGFSPTERTLLYAGITSGSSRETFGLVDLATMKELLVRTIPIRGGTHVAFSYRGDLLGVLYNETSAEASLIRTCDGQTYRHNTMPIQQSTTFLVGQSGNTYVVARDTDCHTLASVPTTPVTCPLTTIRPPPVYVESVGRHFSATVDLLTGQTIARGSAVISGVVESQIFLPANHPIRRYLFRPDTHEIAVADFITPSSGSTFTLPSFYLHTDEGADSDSDGLSDDAEFIIGTDAYQSSTAADGISDAEKVAQGLDPFTNRPFPTNVIAGLTLPGTAKEVILEGSTNQQQTAYLALGSGGFGIVNVSQFRTPVLLSQLSLPGDATDVAVDPNLQMAVVAANGGGLHFVSVTEPMNPVWLEMVDIAASQVEIVTGFAYVASGNRINAYDLLSRQLLQSLPTGGATITGLAKEGLFLYAMDTNRTIHTIDLSDGSMVSRGSLQLPAGGGKLCVGNGIAYVAAATETFGGFATVDVSNPEKPVLLSGVDTPSVEGGAIALNGSGLAVTIGQLFGFGGQLVKALDVMDVSDASNTGAFLTRFNLPAFPFAVAIGAGIAFVADGTAGLQVVNYRSFDNLGFPPTIRLTSNFTMTSPTNGFVEEGKLVLISAAVTDDVQVRDVEFYLNGAKVFTDLSFPFEHRFVTPRLTDATTNLTIRAKATDTGGNSSWSDEIDIILVKDATLPHVRQVIPEPNSITSTNASKVLVFFTEPMNATTLTSSSVRVINAGMDFDPGTDDDFVVSNATLTVREDVHAAVLSFSEPLPFGFYEVFVDRGITDLAGNSMAKNFRSHFAQFASGPDGDDDGDGLSNALEISFGSNPRRVDSDGDGWTDEMEYSEGTDPREPQSHPSRWVFAKPPLQIALPGPGSFGNAGSPTFIARPPLSLSFTNSRVQP